MTMYDVIGISACQHNCMRQSYRFANQTEGCVPSDVPTARNELRCACNRNATSG